MHAISFPEGNQQTDTVFAELSQALNVMVRGAPRGTVVRFESLPSDSVQSAPGLYVESLTSQFYSTFLADSTDDAGEAHALIKLGAVAGTGRLKVTVPALDLEAVATFTVLPGHAYHVMAFPKDTALFVSRTLQARGAVTDRFGNRRTDPVAYANLSGNATASATGEITATAIGRAMYEVRSGSVADTGYVSVVPSGTIAAMRIPVSGSAPELVMFQLDGSGLTVLAPLSIPTFDDPNPRWSPDGSRIVYSSGVGGLSRLFTVTPTGDVARLIPSPPADLVAEIWPHYTHDGAYVYFSGIRMKYFNPDTTSSWYLNGTTPRWDPVGDRLAYLQSYGGPISIVNGDGTGARVISAPGRSYEERTFDWSSDGQWIVARGVNTLELLNVASGLTLPLGYSSNMNMPTWRP